MPKAHIYFARLEAAQGQALVVDKENIFLFNFRISSGTWQIKQLLSDQIADDSTLFGGLSHSKGVDIFSFISGQIQYMSKAFFSTQEKDLKVFQERSKYL